MIRLFPTDTSETGHLIGREWTQANARLKADQNRVTDLINKSEQLLKRVTLQVEEARKVSAHANANNVDVDTYEMIVKLNKDIVTARDLAIKIVASVIDQQVHLK